MGNENLEILHFIANKLGADTCQETEFVSVLLGAVRIPRRPKMRRWLRLEWRSKYELNVKRKKVEKNKMRNNDDERDDGECDEVEDGKEYAECGDDEKNGVVQTVV